jgi:hypothetical protein
MSQKQIAVKTLIDSSERKFILFLNWLIYFFDLQKACGNLLLARQGTNLKKKKKKIPAKEKKNGWHLRKYSW